MTNGGIVEQIMKATEPARGTDVFGVPSSPAWPFATARCLAKFSRHQVAYSI